MEALKLAIQRAVTTGFVDDSENSLIDYRPNIITNEPEINEKVLSTLIDELRSCESFFLSVAFITSGGVASLFGVLLDLQARNINGRILVSDYLNFTQPEAIKKLMQLRNVELRISRNIDFHSKGFIFTHAEYYTIIIGSSNLTHGALTKNKEWNLKVTAHKDSELFKSTINEFNSVFSKSYEITPSYLEKYAFAHRSEKRLREGLKKALLDSESLNISPNKMQRYALENLEALRKSGKDKALIVSATGTGKTYLSAFDVSNYKPKRLLFLVHRRNIAAKAMLSYKDILEDEISMGLYSGNVRNTNADYIFSTVQTFSRDEHLKAFSPGHFDYIVIDETHRASANSYQKILAHFCPKFLLGMTATPERTDGLDVFALFDYNIASEVRLHDALSHDMLVPFHYYGISDIQVDGSYLDEKTSINDLNTHDRVEHIIKNTKLFGTDDGIVRGLVFCSRQEECTFLSEEFNKRGYNTIALTGKSSEDDRSRAIDLLETDDLNIKLDYIFTVDIFNEGVDIPKVNQIVMLRPTQSAIVFVQQLGRGLRISEGKSYVTVIDFIGNYQNNYLVPVALFGDRTFEKDNLRKLVHRSEQFIVGASTIYFDRIVKERIFHSIDSTKLNKKRTLLEEYKLLKGKIGRIPVLMDFVNHGERDPYQYVEEYGSYYTFLHEVEKREIPLDNNIKNLLTFLSKEVLNPIRFVDIHLFKTLLELKEIPLQQYLQNYKKEFDISLSNNVVNHSIHHINGGFLTESGPDKKKVPIGLNRGYNIIDFSVNRIQIGNTLDELLKIDFVKSYLKDLCDYSIWKLRGASDTFALNNFSLYQRYSRKDVFRILNWNENPVAQNVGGYMVSKDKKDCAIFVNYHKEASISESTKYHDRFISRSEFIWMSKNKRRLKSPDVDSILSQKKHGMRIPLFVKKSNSEGLEFFFMGDLTIVEGSAIEKEIKTDKNKTVSVVEMKFLINQPIDRAIYDYIIDSD